MTTMLYQITLIIFFYNFFNILNFFEKNLTIYFIYLFIFDLIFLMHNKEMISDEFLIIILFYFFIYQIFKNFKDLFYFLVIFYSILINLDEIFKKIEIKKKEITFLFSIIIENKKVISFFFIFILLVFFNYINIIFKIFFLKCIFFISLFLVLLFYFIFIKFYKKTPNLFIYYPLISSISSVIIRFMGVILLFPILFCIICILINKYIILFEILLFIIIFLNIFHIIYAIKHLIKFKKQIC